MARAKRSKKAPPLPPPRRMASVFDDPPRNNVLLLTCMDQRLLDDTVRFMNDLNLHNRYDQVALAGSAMGARLLPDPNLPDPERWRAVFFLHLQEAINTLHRPIKDVFLLEHLDCGAYKYLHPVKSVKKKYAVAGPKKRTSLHRRELNEFAWEVKQFIDAQQSSAVGQSAKKKAAAWTDIRVSYFVMDLLGEVTQLDVPTDQRDKLTR